MSHSSGEDSMVNFIKKRYDEKKKLKENFGIRKPKSRVIIRNLVHAVDTNLETEKTHVFLVTNTLNLIG